VETTAYFIVEKGEPFDVGKKINLVSEEVFLGRSSGAGTVDIHFSNYLVSRKHCCIKYKNTKPYLYDLGSKHGTLLNGNKILEHQPYILNHNDRIGLAMGIIVLRYFQSVLYEDTIDFNQTNKMNANLLSPLVFDCKKMECKIDGRVILLSSKEWIFLKLLYENANRVVSYKETKSAVWSERNGSSNLLTDVGLDEINVLMYRLRKKMQERGQMIKTIRGMGCILELPKNNDN
jgi:pSer/pThr/pTyr-binding forkhead associated (FHA) protein